MTRTATTDGVVTLAADPRFRRPPTRANRWARNVALIGALALLVSASVRMGWQVAFPLIGVTAVLTLLAVLVWRLTLRSQLTVTITATRLTHRSYGRVRSIARDDHSRCSAVTLLQGGFEISYLVVHGTGRPFALNVDMWPDDELAEIATAVALGPEEPEALTPREADRRFPGLLPFWVRRQTLAAVLLLLALLVVVVPALFAAGTMLDDEPSRRTGVEDVGSAAPAPGPAAEVSDEAAAAQNRLLGEVTNLVGDPDAWIYRDPEVQACADGGDQRVLVARNGPPLAGEADPTAVAAAARRAGLEETDDSTGTELEYVDPHTSAFLRVVVVGGVAAVTSGSACSGDEPQG